MSDRGNSSGVKSVIYCRVSSVAQMQKGYGIASQETRCREFASHKGYEVAQTFTDGAVTGGMIDRPGMSAMLAWLKAQKKSGPYVVLIDDISRLARSVKAHLELRDAISGAGARLESPSVEFGEDSDSVLVENLLASVSQRQRQKNPEQTRNRMRARIMNGYWPFISCAGYRFQHSPGGGKSLCGTNLWPRSFRRGWKATPPVASSSRAKSNASLNPVPPFRARTSAGKFATNW